MKTKGINRVVIVVKDLDRAVALYSKLLNTTFYPLVTAEEYGVHAVFSYEAGIEIASPIVGSKEPTALAVAQQIEEHGEGLHSVVFSIDDVEQACAKAEEMRIRVLQKIVADKDDLKKSFQGRFSKFVEYFLNPRDTHGVRVVLGQFDSAKDG